MSVAILCAGPHFPDDAIASELERRDIQVIRVAGVGDQFQHDADLAAQRILEVAAQVPNGTPVGYVASSVAAAGAIIAAVQRPDLVTAIVSVNGRTDLASDAIHNLRAPTLLVVNDMPVLRMNREAVAMMHCEKRIEIIHGEGHGAVDAIVEKAARWFADRLAGVSV